MLAGVVYDKIRTLHRFMDREDPLPQRRKFFLYHLAAVEEFLKYSYSSHVWINVAIYNYLQEHLILSGVLTSSESHKSNFCTCKILLQALELIREALESADFVDTVIYIAAARFHLYWGHKIIIFSSISLNRVGMLTCGSFPFVPMAVI